MKRAMRSLVDRTWLVTWGHYGWPVPLLLGVGARWMPSMRSGSVLVAAAIVLLVPSMVHSAGMCPRCMPAMVPTDTSEQVARSRWVLEWVHRPFSQPVTWALVGVHVLLTAAGWWWSPLCMRLTAVTFAVALLGPLAAYRVHARLRPWCPLCQGRGPDDEDAPVPDGPGGLELDPTPPSAPDDELTVDALQRFWQARPAPTGPRPDAPVRSGSAGLLPETGDHCEEGLTR